MLKRILIIVLLSCLVTGCNSKRDRIYKGTLQFPLPSADIAFETIENVEGRVSGDNVVGFYSIKDGTITTKNFGPDLINPDYLNPETLISINKQGNPGSIIGFGGYVYIVKGDRFLECHSASTFGGDIQPHKQNILINQTSTQINLISSEDCSLLRVVISKADLSEFGPNVWIGSYSLSENEEFIILSLDRSSEGLLVNKNLVDMSYKIYNTFGIHPSISPDQTKVAYLAIDGIHVMNLEGENDELLVPYQTSNSGNAFFDRGKQPLPKWSKDGSKLIYHKCNQLSFKDCENIANYYIYEYDIKTRTEILLFHSGINPSYRP